VVLLEVIEMDRIMAYFRDKKTLAYDREELRASKYPLLSRGGQEALFVPQLPFEPPLGQG
jgi:hypothetical protein